MVGVGLVSGGVGKVGRGPCVPGVFGDRGRQVHTESCTDGKNRGPHSECCGPLGVVGYQQGHTSDQE